MLQDDVASVFRKKPTESQLPSVLNLSVHGAAGRSGARRYLQAFRPHLHLNCKKISNLAHRELFLRHLRLSL